MYPQLSQNLHWPMSRHTQNPEEKRLKVPLLSPSSTIQKSSDSHDILIKGEQKNDGTFDCKPNLSDHDVDKATLYIMDSFSGQGIAHGVRHEDLETHKFLHGSAWEKLYVLSIVVYMVEGLVPDSMFKGQKEVSCGAEAAFLLCFFYDVLLFWRLESGSTEENGTKTGPEIWTKGRALLIFFQLVDLLVFLIFIVFYDGNSLRFSRFARPLLLVFRVPNLRIVLVGCLFAATRIVRVLFLIACDVMFFGFIGFVLFDSKEFESPQNGMHTMLLILTAPGTVLGVMEPLNASSGNFASIFFIFFVIITTMIFQKITLATAYRSYKAHQKKEFFASMDRSHKALVAAFDIIAVNGRVSQATWRIVFADLKGSPHPKVADTIFHACDSEFSLVPGNGYVEFDAFKELTNMAKHAKSALKHLELHDHHELTDWEKVQKRMRRYLNCNIVVWGCKIQVVHAFVDMLVILSIVQLYMSVSNSSGENHAMDAFWETLGVCILFAFTVEVSLKSIAMGWAKYISYGEHVLDFTCVAAGIIFFTWEWLYELLNPGKGDSGGTLYNIALALRTLRVLKFLWLSETLHGLLFTVIKLGNSLVKLFFILFVPVYIFAVVSQSLLHNYVNVKNKAKAVGTPWYPFAEQLNFETGLNAMLTLFQMFTISSWNMVMAASDKIIGPNYSVLVEIFFFSFRIIMTMIFVPILTGFLIESFVTNFDTYEKHKKEGEQKKGGTENSAGADLSHAMEIRVLAARTKRNRRTSYVERTMHPKDLEVKKLLSERTAVEEVEKKIYGVDLMLKEKLIKTLRNKLQEESQLLQEKEYHLADVVQQAQKLEAEKKRLSVQVLKLKSY